MGVFLSEQAAVRLDPAVVAAATCYECGSEDVEVWQVEPDPAYPESPHLRLDYWCPSCQQHRHHSIEQ